MSQKYPLCQHKVTQNRILPRPPDQTWYHSIEEYLAFARRLFRL